MHGQRPRHNPRAAAGPDGGDLFVGVCCGGKAANCQAVFDTSGTAGLGAGTRGGAFQVSDAALERLFHQVLLQGKWGEEFEEAH